MDYADFMNPTISRRTYISIIETAWKLKSGKILDVIEIPTWNFRQLPVALRFVWTEAEDLSVFVLFPKLHKGNLVKGKIQFCDFMFDWEFDDASLEYNRKELHNEPMTLLDFAVAMDRIDWKDFTFYEDNNYLHMPRKYTPFRNYDIYQR